MTAKGYLALFLAVLILGLCCAALWLWKEKDNAQAALIAAQTQIVAADKQHKDDQSTITRLTEYREANGKLMQIFVGKVADIQGKFSDLDRNIQNLRRTNPDVEKYLAMPIPPALLCFLDGLCNKAGTAAPAK